MVSDTAPARRDLSKSLVNSVKNCNENSVSRTWGSDIGDETSSYRVVLQQDHSDDGSICQTSEHESGRSQRSPRERLDEVRKRSRGHLYVYDQNHGLREVLRRRLAYLFLDLTPIYAVTNYGPVGPLNSAISTIRLLPPFSNYPLLILNHFRISKTAGFPR